MKNFNDSQLRNLRDIYINKTVEYLVAQVNYYNANCEEGFEVDLIEVVEDIFKKAKLQKL